MVVKNYAKLSGFTAKKREEMKNDKYDSEILPGGNASKCIPVVFEHFGTWGVATDRLLEHFVTKIKSKDQEGKNNSADFKTYRRRRFSVTLQKINARVIMKQLNIVQGGFLLVDELRRVQAHPH